MPRNVLDFEPAIALFVPDEDALVFYKKIALFSKTHLVKHGYIFLEINETLGNEVVHLYESIGYVVELKKDLQGKDRLLKITFDWVENVVYPIKIHRCRVDTKKIKYYYTLYVNYVSRSLINYYLEAPI